MGGIGDGMQATDDARGVNLEHTIVWYMQPIVDEDSDREGEKSRARNSNPPL